MNIPAERGGGPDGERLYRGPGDRRAAQRGIEANDSDIDRFQEAGLLVPLVFDFLRTFMLPQSHEEQPPVDHEEIVDGIDGIIAGPDPPDVERTGEDASHPSRDPAAAERPGADTPHRARTAPEATGRSASVLRLWGWGRIARIAGSRLRYRPSRPADI